MAKPMKAMAAKVDSAAKFDSGNLPANEYYDYFITDEIMKLLLQTKQAQDFESSIRQNLKPMSCEVEEGEVSLPQFSLSIGYMVAVRNKLNGLTMTEQITRPFDGNMAFKYFTVCFFFTSDKQTLLDEWSPSAFLSVGNSYSRKSNALRDHEDRLKLNSVVPSNPLPDHFSDVEIQNALLSPDDYSHFQNRFELTCGLLLKTRTAVLRIVRRTLHYRYDPENKNQMMMLIFSAIEYFLVQRERELLLCEWAPESLYAASLELSKKAINLSPSLQHELCEARLIKKSLGEGECQLVFDSSFLVKVSRYHNKTERPEGTFELPAAVEIAAAEDSFDGDSNSNTSGTSKLLAALASLQREQCHQCGSRRQIYCGPCGGIRLPACQQYLPPRIELPFDILLVLHWHETLHKCTGIHAAVMALENQVSVAHWQRERGEIAPVGEKEINDIDAHDENRMQEPIWGHLVRSLDANRDILLFPSSEAVSAELFNWSGNSISSCSSTSSKWRLVVLEASWMYGKSIFKKIMRYRRAWNLPQLQCVCLENIVGGYWKFHTEGHGAVSSIEAIAHTAAAAGLDADCFDHLLLLFKLQKHRVLDRVSTGGKPPKAVCVSGSGIGSWRSLTDFAIENDETI